MAGTIVAAILPLEGANTSLPVLLLQLHLPLPPPGESIPALSMSGCWTRSGW
eukprot:CAMPEP_0179139546 /NCGR_PEP_ID=MMETSP0796-20121207/66753_1 /TAXON_ID=73915 /ORGANISM="Pyrodinium bahamense, Strain pbaha01" /LENGTH=51 /DNA_ID=CAMNT_0020838995 /DNA_START=322 /DNA_END=474 /DNA_ORIENTATION=-